MINKITQRQEAEKKKLANIVKSAGKPKAKKRPLKQADIDNAVTATLEAAARKLVHEAKLNPSWSAALQNAACWVRTTVADRATVDKESLTVEVAQSPSQPLVEVQEPSMSMFANRADYDAETLRQRCIEVIAWQNTGMLPGNSLRKLAETIPDDDGSALQRAESKTARQALEFVVAAAPVRGLPLTEVDWIAVGRILEAQQRLRGIHSIGTSNWGAAIWKAAHGIGTTAPGGDGAES